jgi:hypothetical protein
MQLNVNASDIQQRLLASSANMSERLSGNEIATDLASWFREDMQSNRTVYVAALEQWLCCSTDAFQLGLAVSLAHAWHLTELRSTLIEQSERPHVPVAFRQSCIAVADILA